MLCIFLGPTKSPDPVQYVNVVPWRNLEVAVAGVGLVQRTRDLATYDKKNREIAGEVQAAIVRGVGPCEDNPLIGHFPDGLHRRAVLAQETPPERYERRLRELGQAHFIKMLPYTESGDPFDNEPLQPTNISTLEIVPYVGSDMVWVSPRIDDAMGRKLDFDDLPEGWVWGNGVTCNSWVKLKTGEAILLSWCVLAPATALAVKASPTRWRTLCDLMEA